MDFANRPMTDFYRHCLPAAYESGFSWVCTLLARDVDVERLYATLRRCWGSLDSITGKHFLFIFAGKENHTHEERFQSKILDKRKSWVGEYNNFVTFFNPNTSLKYGRMQYDWRKDKEGNLRNVSENQTEAINSLIEFFGLDESDTPCLVFTSLVHRRFGSEVKTHAVPVSGDDVYRYFKNLFNRISPTLKRIKVSTLRLQSLSNQERDLKKKIEQLALNGDGKIAVLQKELLAIAEKGALDSLGRSLSDCIENLSYGKFEQPIRGLLSKYVDLVNNYEKRTGLRFNPDLINAKESQKLMKKIQLEAELTATCQERDDLGNLCGEFHAEINKIIRGSKMSEKTNPDGRLSIAVNGGTAQINAAFDNGSVEATQYISVDVVRLSELIGNIRKASTAEMPSEEIETVNINLEVIEEELKEKQPRKSFIKAALSSLKAIKGTVEFGAAVAALIQFVQTLT